MRRRLFLHIGLHKTGSTAIQNAFAGLDDGTTAYLDLGHPNHSYGMAALFCEEQAENIVASGMVRSLGDLRRTADRARRAAEAQIVRGSRNLILSGEEMSGRFGAVEIGRLKAFFAPHFDDLRVIVYLRDPWSFMRSAIQEILKRAPCRLTPGPFPAYRDRLAPWEEAFGRGAIDYVLFSPETLSGGDVVRDFALRVGVDPDRVRSARANESMSAEAFAALYRLRQGLPSGLSAWNRARLEVAARRMGGFGNRQFAIAHHVWEADVTARSEDMAWAEERLGRRFVPPLPRPGAVIFGSEADVLAFGATYEAAFQEWARQAVPFRRVARSYLRSLRRRG